MGGPASHQRMCGVCRRDLQSRAHRGLPCPSLTPLPFSQSPLKPSLRSQTQPFPKPFTLYPARQARRVIVSIFQEQKLRPRDDSLDKTYSEKVAELRFGPRTTCLQSLCSDHCHTSAATHSNPFTSLSLLLARRSRRGNVSLPLPSPWRPALS